jgi:polyisoprenoid-binding protein YceI
MSKLHTPTHSKRRTYANRGSDAAPLDIDAQHLRAAPRDAPANEVGTRDAEHRGMNTHRISRAAADQPGVQPPERWEVDPTRSALEFSLRHLVIQEIRGKFHRWGGTLFVDRADPSRSRVDVWVDLASLDTGSEERDAHVRSPEFLDIGRFPRARFYSTAVEPAEERIRVRGNLHLHGVSHAVELEVVPGPTSVDAHGVRHGAYAAHGVMDRQAFGLHWNQDLDIGGVVVGDRIEISVRAEMVQVPNMAPADPG